MIFEISANSDFFILNFCTHCIYMYTSHFLHLQLNWICATCPVASKAGGFDPRRNYRSLPHLENLGAKVIGVGLNFPQARSTYPIDL